MPIVDRANFPFLVSKKPQISKKKMLFMQQIGKDQKTNHKGHRDHRGFRIDELVKSRKPTEFVIPTKLKFHSTGCKPLTWMIPAKAGIQLFQDVLDPGFRRGDARRDFLRVHQKFFFR